MDFTVILWFFAAGLALALIYTTLVKRVLGRLVRALLAIDAVTPEAAITPEKLGVPVTQAVELAIKYDTSFRKTVIFLPGGACYVAPDMVSRAKVEYRDDKGGAIIMFAMLLMIFAVALVAVYLFPEIYKYAETVFESIFGGK